MFKNTLLNLIVSCFFCILLNGNVLAQLEEADPAGNYKLIRKWPGPDGKPLPFEDVAQVIDFLKTSDITDTEGVEEGITGVRKVLLEKNGIQMHAVFRDVSIFKPVIRFANGKSSINFRDEAVFECAAFELSRLLEFKYVPPAVPREIGGKDGTVQAWIEDSIMEKELLEEQKKVPDPWLWAMQHQVQRVFDNLIYNEDRNLGNILYTPQSKMVLIDHTRSFRLKKELLEDVGIRYCERSLYENLKSLNKNDLDAVLKPHLTNLQIEAILARRDLLAQHLDELIEQHGESDVLFRFYKVENK